MNGVSEEADFNKINKQLHHACSGIENAYPSLIAARSHLKLKDGMHTSRIQDILIETTKALITEETPQYSIVAARLISHKIRKFAFGHYTPPHLLNHVKQCVGLGKYDNDVLNKWSEEDFDYFNSVIDHQRDNDFHLAAMNQWTGKYLMRLKKDDISTIVESPQFVYMMISMTLHHTREAVVSAYNQFSLHKMSLPTPIMAGVRSPTRQYSSCVLIDTGDSLESINHSVKTLVDYVSDRAGIGLSMGRIRGVGSNIGHGEKIHTGVLPFLKYAVGGLKSCSQGGVRGGSATVYFPLWHWEIESILTWKNNRGTEESRERRVDYGIQISNSMIHLLAEDGDLYLFDPHEDLYQAYFTSDEAFREVYQRYVTAFKAGLVRGKKVRITDIFQHLIDARSETGRYYITFVNNMNDYSPFDPNLYPISMSNLCLEVALPTKPGPKGITSLCTLSSVNMGQFATIELIREKLPETIRTMVRTLDNLLSYQDYAAEDAWYSTQLFRSLGIGVVNLADFLAQNNARYGSQKALELVNYFWATMYYHAKKESILLAKELGACEASATNRSSIRPFTHKLHNQFTNINGRLGLSDYDDEFNWEELEAMYQDYGIRNATLFAVAPTETSSQLLNATNGVEMPRSVISIKGSKDSSSAQVIPNPQIRDQYDYLWDQESPVPYITTVAVIGKWCDQAISTNTPYNPKNFHDGKIPRQTMLDHLLYGWSLGLKTFYYNVMNDGATDKLEVRKEETSDACESGACVI